MTLQTPTPPHPKPVYQPNDAQKARAAALRRFNWLTIYTPLIVGAIVVMVLIGLMLWGVFSPQIEGTGAFLSGLADIILIVFALPMTLVCAIGPLALGGFLVYTVQKRQEQKELPPAQQPHGNWLQTLFWRLDHLLDTIFAKIKAFLPKLSNLVIQLNGFLAYVESWLVWFKRLFTRS
ncbi:MAG: hypothetical protein GY943_13940 [Chloroflexi bacterium]|nr:hypothetical protein [Chloroflexota bacterium]